MRVPESWRDKHGEMTLFWSRVEPTFVEVCRIGNEEVTFLYETPRSGFGYGCSPSDVTYVLEKIEENQSHFPDMIIFRQPTRKQAQQASVWGRFLYLATVGKHEGTAIVLEAQEFGSKLSWPKKLKVEDQLELKRLKEDGHVFRETKRGYFTLLTEIAVRNTILYRTLLHELGHFRQYQEHTEYPETRLSDDICIAIELHDSVPEADLEAYAHRFAEEQSKQLRERGVIPFEPKPFVG